MVLNISWCFLLLCILVLLVVVNHQYMRCSQSWAVPLPRIPVTTRIIVFLVGDPVFSTFMCNCYCYWGDNPRYIMVYRCFPRKPTPWFLTSKASASSTAKSTLRGSSLGRAMFHLTPPILWNEVKMKIQFLWESTSQIPKFRLRVHFPVTSRVGEAVSKLCSECINPTRYTDIPYTSCFLNSFHVPYTPWNNRNRAFDSIISRRLAKHPKLSFLANVSPRKTTWSSIYASNFFPFRECPRK